MQLNLSQPGRVGMNLTDNVLHLLVGHKFWVSTDELDSELCRVVNVEYDEDGCSLYLEMVKRGENCLVHYSEIESMTSHR